MGLRPTEEDENQGAYTRGLPPFARNGACAKDAALPAIDGGFGSILETDLGCPILA